MNLICFYKLETRIFRWRLPTYLASWEGESGLVWRSSTFVLSIYEEDTHTNEKYSTPNKQHSIKL